MEALVQAQRRAWAMFGITAAAIPLLAAIASVSGNTFVAGAAAWLTQFTVWGSVPVTVGAAVVMALGLERSARKLFWKTVGMGAGILAGTAAVTLAVIVTVSMVTGSACGTNGIPVATAPGAPLSNFGSKSGGICRVLPW